MIRGIGVDICQISRMQKMSPESRFVSRYFSEAEREYLAKKGAGWAQSLAGMYAAKEAFGKVLGSGIRKFELKEVEVLHGAEGQPYYRLSGKALQALKDRGMREVLLSVSHDGGIAIAFAAGQE